MEIKIEDMIILWLEIRMLFMEDRTIFKDNQIRLVVKGMLFQDKVMMLVVEFLHLEMPVLDLTMLGQRQLVPGQGQDLGL